MSQIASKRKSATAPAVVLVLVLACLGLTACGGSSSSKSSSSSTNAAAVATTSSPGSATGSAKGPATGPAAGSADRIRRELEKRSATMRACLQKQGITPPQRAPGRRGAPGAGGPPGATGGPQLPKGVTRAQYEAALKKCGGPNFAARGPRFNSPALKTAFAKYASCLRQNGVNVPAPNTSGKGPVFDTKGIDTKSAQFKTAETKCQSILRSAFKRRPGAGGPPGGAAPPAG